MQDTTCDLNILGAFEDTLALGANGQMPGSGPLGYPHIYDMYTRIRTDGFSYAKQCRWLGWAQAAVVASGSATLQDMKDINRKHQIAEIDELEENRHE